MKLIQLEVGDEDTSTMHVKDPRDSAGLKDLLDDSGNPMTITMRSVDSPVVRDATRRVTAKRMLDSPNSIVTTEEAVASIKSAESRDIEIVASAAMGWSLSLDEPDTKFSFAKCCEAFRRFPWLFNQANRFLGARANFIKASPDA